MKILHNIKFKKNVDFSFTSPEWIRFKESLNGDNLRFSLFVFNLCSLKQKHVIIYAYKVKYQKVYIDILQKLKVIVSYSQWQSHVCEFIYRTFFKLWACTHNMVLTAKKFVLDSFK